MGLERQNADSPPRISVVIVTYRSTNELPGCMESLLQQSVPIEIFLVDNASPDATPALVKGYAERFSNVHAILNAENLGLAAGNNCALGRCKGDYVLILNPDTVLPADTLQRMSDFLDRNPDVGVIGPKCLYENGTSHVSFHRNWGILHVLAWRVLPYRFVRKLYDWFSSYKCQDVAFVSGACLLIRRRTFEEIGGYDPEYFLTVEDALDLCIRANRTGSRTVFFPGATVIHYTGRSATQTPYLVVWQGIRGTIYHFLKHRGKLQAVVVSSLLGMSAALRVVTAGIFGLASARYRAVARVYASVLRDLVFRSPIRINHAGGHTPAVQCKRASSVKCDSRTGLPPRVHIVVLNWNNYDDTASCLSSLRRLNYDNYAALVIDNGSSDDSASRLQTAFPEVKVISTGKNLGFAGGCNFGIRHALGQDSDFVWLLNNDAQVDRGALQAQISRAQHNAHTGAVGSAIYFVNQPEQLQAWGGGYVNFWLGRSRHFLHPVPDESIDFITGASMLITRQAIEDVGLLDESFFMYWEDADYCFRLRAAGWKLAVAPQSRVWHKGSSSVGKESVKLDQYFNSSARRFFRKHARVPALPICIGTALRMAIRAAKGDWKRVRAVVAANAEASAVHRESGGGRVRTLEADQKRG